MKTIKEYIQEKLVINKDTNLFSEVPIPDSTKLEDIENAWCNLFDDIYMLKTGNIHLGKLKLSNNTKSIYTDNDFTLYPNYRGQITVRRRDPKNGAVLWVQGKTFKEVCDKMTKRFKKEKYEVD